VRYVIAFGAAVLASAALATEPAGDSQIDQEVLIRDLFRTIEMLSGYRVIKAAPPLHYLPQHEIEAKICEAPCNVSAAYLPREGIFLSGNLDPVREPMDRAALLHELVHYLQQGHPKFENLRGCERERAKEVEAYAIQNAYLASIGRKERVAFYDGEFDCD
jgi:hypothetical protein